MSVSSKDLRKLSDKTVEMNDDDVDLFTWIVDGKSTSAVGLAYVGTACYNGRRGRGGSKTSMTAGPSRRNGIIETAEVCRNSLRL